MSEQHHTIRVLAPRNQLAFAAGFGFVMGVATRNAMLLFVGFAGLSVILWSAWLASRQIGSIRVRRTHPSRAFENQHVSVLLTIENEGPLAPSMVVVEDHFPPGASYRLRHLIASPLHRGEAIEFHYTQECVHRRGAYTIGPVRLGACDPLGLIAREVVHEEFTSLLLYPNGVDLRFARVLGDGTLSHVGIETVLRPGNSTEFTGLREYRPGDSPGTIHWRSSARAGRFMVKEFEEDLVTDVAFFLDLGRMGLTGLGDQTSFEYAIKATASLAGRAIDLAHRVQVFAVGSQAEHIPLGSGRRHLLMILDRLAMLKAEGDTVFAAEVLRRVPMLRPGGTVVLVLSLTMVTVESTMPLLAALTARRLLPLIVLIDDRAFIKIYREQEIRHVTAMGLDETVKFLALHGARVHLVTKAKSPHQALVQGLERSAFGDD